MKIQLTKTHGQLIYQDLVFFKSKSQIETLANKVECYVCGKGLEDEHSLTAKAQLGGTFLFCEKHYPQN